MKWESLKNLAESLAGSGSGEQRKEERKESALLLSWYNLLLLV
jgi:hypothetical protein